MKRGSTLKLFTPYINLMRRLRNVQIFSFVGLILGVPIIIAASFVIVEMNKEINEIKERQIGAEYSKLLKELLHHTQQYRGITISLLSGIEFSPNDQELK